MKDKPRSIDQHRRLFGLIKAAYDHWPESHEFKPDNEEHLRAYLLVKAKHRTIKEFYLSEDATEAAKVVPVVVATMLNKYAWAWGEGNALKVCVPDSIAWDKCPHHLFCKISDDVSGVLEREAGLTAEDLMREAA